MFAALCLVVLFANTLYAGIPRITLGTGSNDSFYQSIVSLKEKYLESHFCGGIILSKDWILTAGHCFTARLWMPTDYLAVDVGSEYLDNTNGTRYDITDYYLHPNKSESIYIYKNDLALIKLADPIEFTDRVQPAKLGAIEDQKELPVVAGGWGQRSEDDTLHDILRYVSLKTLRYEECVRIHARKNNLVDRETNICGYRNGEETLCFGDSGGALMDEGGYLVGVFSALEDCSGEYPVLFMRVESYIDWINQVTKLNLTIHYH